MNEMKSIDNFNIGMLKKFAALNSFIKAGVHSNLNSQTILDLFNLYSDEKSDTIEYQKFLNNLVKDIQKFINFDDNLKETLEKYNYEGNYTNKRPKSSQPFGRISERNNFNSTKIQINTNSILDRKIELEEVYKEIKAIKIIFNQIKKKFLNSFDQKISTTEFINILREFSIIFPKEKILKILSFIEIPNIQAFSFKDFEVYLDRCKILSNEITSEEIISAIRRLNDVIYSLGGVNFLFKSTENQIDNLKESEKSINKNIFIKLLKNKSNISEEVLEAIYSFITKSNRDLTKEDFEKYFGSSLQKNEQTSQINEDFEITALRQINEKLFSNNFKHDDYFDHFLNQKINRTDSVINLADFNFALRKEKFSFTEEEIEYLFTIFDRNRDNVIDRQEFITTLKKVYKAKFKFIDLIKREKLDIEDLMLRMQIDMKSDINKKFDFFTFKNKIRLLDHTLENEFIKSLFEEMKTGDYVEYSTLETEMNVFKRQNFRNINNEAFSDNFKNHLRTVTTYKDIKDLCEKLDSLGNGLLSKLDFCKIIRNITNDYRDEDIMKYLRLFSLISKDNKVKYPDFLDLVFYNSKEDKFFDLVDSLKNFYFTECNKDIDFLFAIISEKEFSKPVGNVYIEDKNKTVTLTEFLNFLKKKLSFSDDMNKNVLCKFDLDADGKISKNDIKAILERYTNTSFFKRENSYKKLEVNLQALEVGGLSTERFKKIIMIIKSAMKAKNLTEIGLFHKLDTNNDGFLSNPEFNKNIDEIIKLSPSFKDQLFNYLDVRSLGLVDKDTFLKRFKEFQSDVIILKNSWDVENLILLQITKWIRSNKKITDEEIFVILDSDFDGIINISDFRKFLINKLNFSKNDFDDYKLQRVMSKISLTRNENICQGDIKEFVKKCRSDENGDSNKKMTDSIVSPNMKNSREDYWISDAIERLSLYISENYKNIDAFFKENIQANSQDRMKLEDFNKFLFKHPKCFLGFKFTSDEIIAIYSELDSHKKSYITLDDLKNKFSNTDFTIKMQIDIKNFIKNNFINGIEAFSYFKNTNYKNSDGVRDFTLTHKEIFDGINNLFPSKYQTNSIINYLDKTFKDVNSIPFSEFNYVYFDQVLPDDVLNKHVINFTARIKSSKISRRLGIENRPFTSRHGEFNKTLKRSQSASLANNTLKTTTNKYFEKDFIKKIQLATPFDDNPLEKIKRIILTSRFDFKNYFKMYEMMTDKGMLNQFEFKNMLKKLNLGLTSIEIDVIHAKAGKERDGRINLREFVKFIVTDEENLGIVRKNSEAFISEIKQLLYKYYTNMKIAFQFNDENNSNQMDLVKFKNIINDLFKRETRAIPNFSLIKSAFDYLDIKKDGIIDLNEWLRSFATTRSSLDIRNPGNPIVLKQISDWENSSNVYSVYQLITKHKKLIKEKVRPMLIQQKTKNLVHSDNLISVLKEVLVNFEMNNTKWKIIVAIGDRDRSSLIDLDLFMNVVENSAKKASSHPKFN